MILNNKSYQVIFITLNIQMDEQIIFKIIVLGQQGINFNYSRSGQISNVNQIHERIILISIYCHHWS